jgi:hypothetical protein
MKELVKGRSVREVQSKIDRMVKRDWKQISDIQLDPSQANFNIIEYVCVMETEDKQHTGRKWGKRYHLN